VSRAVTIKFRLLIIDFYSISIKISRHLKHLVKVILVLMVTLRYLGSDAKSWNFDCHLLLGWVILVTQEGDFLLDGVACFTSIGTLEDWPLRPASAKSWE